MAAAGVAVASAISQYLSAVLILRNLLRREDTCRIYSRKLRLHPAATRAVLLIGIPTGIQNALFAIANLFVQSGVNSFDAVMVSGNAAAANADTLIYNVMAAFHTACASFVSRNLGAGNRNRMMKSYLISLSYSFLSGALLGGLLLIFGRQFLTLFANESSVIDAGMERLRIMGWCYCVSAFMDCTIAASRGIGKSIPPTVIVIMGSCVFPDYLGLYDFRLLPHHPIPVPIVYFLLGHYRLCGNHLFSGQLPKAHAQHRSPSRRIKKSSALRFGMQTIFMH